MLPVGLLALMVVLIPGCGGSPAPSPAPSADDEVATIRVGIFNVQELSREKLEEGGGPGMAHHPQLWAAAAILREVRPDILVLQEVDHLPHLPPGDGVVRQFQADYLEVGDDPLTYPHLYMAPSNTGELSGLDLDGRDGAATPENRGTDAHGQDSWGYGVYPGQYAMAVLSRFPIDTAAVRTFRLFPWSELPGHHMPEGYFPPGIREQVRLSSKSHWDVPVSTPAGTLHLLVSHPTPPAFDGPEGRNQRRNFDEIGFWAHYLDGHGALRDDAGVSGGWRGAPFVVAGDLNADPTRYEISFQGQTAIGQLLEHPAVHDPVELLRSGGAREASAAREPLDEMNTAAFLGGRRVDYLLPDRRLEAVDGGVYWPDPAIDPEGAARAALASDHRLVWLDLAGPFPD
jgi:endonuclease/exonuclease/phosphatase family metal-dependent hydrolase